MFNSTNFSLPADAWSESETWKTVGGNRLHVLMQPDNYVLVVSLMPANYA